MNGAPGQQDTRKFPLSIGRRRRYLASRFDLARTSILELGAMNMPTFFPNEAEIAFMDYYSDIEFADLAKRGLLSRPLEQLMPVELVVKEKHFSAAISKRFDLIIAAHVVEHIPDPISWLAELASLLNENGSIFLAVPDRRFTLDYLRHVTTPIDLVKAYEADARQLDIYTTADFLYYKRSVQAKDSWREPESLQAKLAERGPTVRDAISRARSLVVASDANVNVHAHVFSGDTFGAVWQGVEETGLLPLRMEELIDVQQDGNEFWALLRRKPEPSLAARRPSKGRKFVVGRNGNLFLDNDTNLVMEQITGKRPLSERDARRWCRLLEGRHLLLAQQGILYGFCVAPTKEVVLADQLPDGIVLSDERPINRIAEFLKVHSLVRFAYPLAALQSTRRAGAVVYPKGDTHWTDFGAYAAYKAYLDAVRGPLDFPAVAESRLIEDETEIMGDLQRHAGDTVPERIRTLSIIDPKWTTVFDNRRPNRGNVIITENHAALPIRVVIFRDSFTHQLIPFFAETFRRCVFVWNPFVDFDLVESEKPDLVLNVMAERFLLQIPDDTNNFSHEEIAIIQRMKGGVDSPVFG